MSAGTTIRHCHHAARTTGRHTSSRSTRAARSFGWIVPTAILALLPKCPLCIAAWIAVFGFGVSLSVIARLRTAIVALCITSLIAFASVTLRRTFASHRQA